MGFSLKRKDGRNEEINLYFFVKNEKYSHNLISDYRDFCVQNPLINIKEGYIDRSLDNKWFILKINHTGMMGIYPNNTLKELNDYFGIKINKIFIELNGIECIVYLKNTVYRVIIYPDYIKMISKLYVWRCYYFTDRNIYSDEITKKDFRLANHPDKKELLCVLKEAYKLFGELRNSFDKEMNELLKDFIDSFLSFCDSLLK